MQVFSFRGAAVGGAIGAATRHPGIGAGVGAALGGIAGALIGDELQGQDKISEEQQRQIQQNQAELERLKKSVRNCKPKTRSIDVPLIDRYGSHEGRSSSGKVSTGSIDILAAVPFVRSRRSTSVGQVSFKSLIWRLLALRDHAIPPQFQINL